MELPEPKTKDKGLSIGLILINVELIFKLHQDTDEENYHHNNKKPSSVIKISFAIH